MRSMVRGREAGGERPAIGEAGARRAERCPERRAKRAQGWRRRATDVRTKKTGRAAIARCRG